MVPPLIYSIPFHRDHDSPFNLPLSAGRPGAQSEVRFRLGRNHRATRAYRHANQLRVIHRRAQHPIQPDRQAAGDGHFRHSTHPPQLESQIGAAQLDRSAPPSALPRPTASASSRCLVSKSPPAADVRHRSARADSVPEQLTSLWLLGKRSTDPASAPSPDSPPAPLGMGSCNATSDDAARPLPPPGPVLHHLV